MPHQCTYCSKIYPDAAEELLKGCECGSRFFYYIRQEKYEELKKETKKVMAELEKTDLKQVEKDIRELTGIADEPDKPVILDLESVRVIRPGKFEIDIVNLFSQKRPIIYKLAEGKYIVDLASSLKKKGAFEFPKTEKVIIDNDIIGEVNENSEDNTSESEESFNEDENLEKDIINQDKNLNDEVLEDYRDDKILDNNDKLIDNEEFNDDKI